MSEWTPKVGDNVMVGEHGPHEVTNDTNAAWGRVTIFDHETLRDWEVSTAWLTPAPGPEPDEPTAPGALVQDERGNLLFRSTGDASRWYEVMTPGGGYWEWDEISRPITVILADPAEVEQLRAEVGVLREQSDSFLTQRDELQRRIDKALALRVREADKWADVFYEQGAILRGHS